MTGCDYSNMLDLTRGDIEIFRSIVDKKSEIGTCKIKAVTIDDLAERSGFSKPKVRATLKKLIQLGWVEEGIKIVNKKSYYVTAFGVAEVAKISKSVLSEV